DASLGREFEDRGTRVGQRPFAARLVGSVQVSRDQGRVASEFPDASRLSHRGAVVQKSLADAQRATREYALQPGTPYVKLANMHPYDAVLDQVPKPLVKRNSILPLFVDGDVLLVAAADLPTPELDDELRLRFGMPVRFALAPPRSIQQAIAKYYAPGL